MFVTFRAGNYRNVKQQKKLYIVDDEDYVLNESYIFLPDYSYKDEDLSVYLMADKYTVIRYSDLSRFFENQCDDCLYVDEFRKALKKHSTPYYKDLYQIMEERFVKKIRQKREKP